MQPISRGKGGQLGNKVGRTMSTSSSYCSQTWVARGIFLWRSAATRLSYEPPGALNGDGNYSILRINYTYENRYSTQSRGLGRCDV
jgi:hypothetical protein